MRISSTDVIEGVRVLHAIGKIKAASAWHAANGAPPRDDWRELVLSAGRKISTPTRSSA
jgi:hypothetical protein